MFPTVEVAARDLCAFRVEQRELVMGLLRERRFRLAASVGGYLFVHAGATSANLATAGLTKAESGDPARVAERLNEVFDEAVAAWSEAAAFSIPGLFEPGSAATGEAGGFLFHRPAHPGAHVASQDRARRFDPRTLPNGLRQVVGHVRDPRCRQLLGDWVRDARSAEGRLRHLTVAGQEVAYRYGLPVAAAHESEMIFIDGGMNHVPATSYELLEL
jgi:hypothetical protein